MFNLLNSVKLFGSILNWNTGTTITWLVVIQVILFLLEVGVCVLLFVKIRRKKKAAAASKESSKGTETTAQNGDSSKK